MSKTKQRLTTTVDGDLVSAGMEAVSAGRAASLSAWVNAALAAQVARDRRLQAMTEAVAAYEAESGEITAAELVGQERSDRQRATVIRSGNVAATPASPGRSAR